VDRLWLTANTEYRSSTLEHDLSITNPFLYHRVVLDVSFTVKNYRQLPVDSHNWQWTQFFPAEDSSNGGAFYETPAQATFFGGQQ
jgi:hypothetical protein